MAIGYTPIILTGSIKFGLSASTNTDYSCWVSALRINRSRNLIEIPATFCDGESSQVPGTEQNEVTLSFIGEQGSTSLWLELWNAFDTDSAELYFEAKFRSGSVSSANPKISGTMLVAGIGAGGTVGELATQEQTFPVKVGTLTKAIA